MRIYGSVIKYFLNFLKILNVIKINKIIDNNKNTENEETIEQSILSKVKNYFDLHKNLRYEDLNNFLDSINLAEVFSSDEDKETIWFLFTEAFDEPYNINEK